MISVVGKNWQAATSITIPTHQAGDLIMLVARRASNTLPTPPVAGGTVPTWSIVQQGAANSLGIITASAIAVDGSTTTGVWTNATSMYVVVFRGDRALSIGASSTGNGGTTFEAVIYPALTLQTADGSSACFRVGTRGAAHAAMDDPPPGYTLQLTDSATAGVVGVHSLLGAGNQSADTISMTGSLAAYRAHTVEIKEAPSGTAHTLNLSDTVTPADSLGRAQDQTLGLGDSISVGDTLDQGRDRQLSLSDTAGVAESFSAVLAAGNCGFVVSSICGTFKAGQSKAGTRRAAMCKSLLFLNGKPFSAGWVADGSIAVFLGRPRLILRGRALQIATESSLVFGRPTLILRGRPLVLPIQTRVSFGKGRLILRGRPTSLQLSAQLSFERPLLILRGGEIAGVGVKLLIPTTPEAITTTPSQPEVLVLTPTEPETFAPAAPAEELLVPTSVVVR